MSIETISAGLAKRGSPATSPLAGSPASVSDLNKLAQVADSKSKRLRELADSIKAAVDTYTEKATARWNETGRTVGEGGLVSDTLGSDRRAMLLEKDIAAYRKAALATNAEERARLRSELRTIKGQADSVAPLWADPVGILMRATVGKRGSYPADVAASGPAELDGYLLEAALTGNKELAAAVFARIEALPKDVRKMVSVNRRDIAEGLVGEAWTNARQWLAMTDIAHDEGHLADMECEGKGAATNAKLSLGMKKKELKALLGTEETEEGAPGTVKKIESDGKTLTQTLDSKYPAVKGSGADALGGVPAEE